MAVDLPVWQPLGQVAGVRLSALAAGIKKSGAPDLALFEFATGTTCAGVFTQNAFRAAPVLVAEEHLAKCNPRAWLVNSGNANAGTGEPGLAAARQSCALLAAALGSLADEVLPFSTGVIGEDLPLERIQTAVPRLVEGLRQDAWEDAARAIMTTDTAPKGLVVDRQVNGISFRVAGISKGAGMIRPDMATMLAFVATDLPIGQPLLERLLREAADNSFNRISIDGDTSTNDACVLAATGQVDCPTLVDPAAPVSQAFSAALREVCGGLAERIVRDGEGATKLIRIQVVGAADADEALRVAYTVAHSPLVKTACFAGDPNWGRILAAVGRSGISRLDLSAVRIHLDDVLIVSQGARAPSYQEGAGARVMAGSEIPITIDLGRGTHSEAVLTTDLSYEYVRINAEYRT
ncbi:MAG: bifunctional glutamate N-acetyltransferase/amino-acid acetyltransferase ArgJ [Pseudomonadota bacterium]|nr:bifunctional glutamate N-acetyltransferase/amino-acid acetyltransferase ArgJ [Pseudomonadota bacterium]